MKNYIIKLRFWLLKKLFTEDEKYLITIALNDKIDKLQTNTITDRCINYENAKSDCKKYKKLKDIFSTRDFN